MDKTKAAFKMALLLLWIGLCCCAAWLVKLLRKPDIRDRVVCLCYGGILRIVGVRLRVTGALAQGRPLLLVSNHLSYLDIVLLGRMHAVRFTPKSEIGGWPVIGGICRLCDAVFIDRRPEKFMQVRQSVQAVLESGAVVSIFPESTTGNGLHLLPFKSAFFSLAEGMGHALHVQPAAITYTRIRHLPIDRAQWPQIAWYGDMELVPHLWQLLTLGPIDARLAFLPPVTLAECGDRKALAAHCHRAIAEAIGEARKE